MIALTALITDMLGEKISVEVMMKLLPILLPVVADLSDGDPHLSQENRLKVQAALHDIKAGLL